MPKIVYTVTEIADMTGYSKEYIRQQIRASKLTAAGGGKGREYRVSRPELQRWWDEEEGGGQLFPKE